MNMQELEITDEDSSSRLLIKYTKTIMIFTTVQIIIVLAIGIYHLISFRRFLSQKNII